MFGTPTHERLGFATWQELEVAARRHDVTFNVRLTESCASCALATDCVFFQCNDWCIDRVCDNYKKEN